MFGGNKPGGGGFTFGANPPGSTPGTGFTFGASSTPAASSGRRGKMSTFLTNSLTSFTVNFQYLTRTFTLTCNLM